VYKHFNILIIFNLQFNCVCSAVCILTEVLINEYCIGSIPRGTEIWGVEVRPSNPEPKHTIRTLRAASWRVETRSCVDCRQRFRLWRNYFGLVINISHCTSNIQYSWRLRLCTRPERKSLYATSQTSNRHRQASPQTPSFAVIRRRRAYFARLSTGFHQKLSSR